MNKTLLTAALLLGATAQAQVGINTAEPKATLHVNSKNPAAGVEGIVYPHATQAEIESWNKADIEEGTIVWNTNQKCLEYFANNKWNSTCGQRTFIPMPGYKLGNHTRYLASVRDRNYTRAGDPDKNIDIEPTASWSTDTSTGADFLLDYSDDIYLNQWQGLPIAIPIEIQTGVYNLPAYTSPPVTITADKTADGQARQLELYWAAQQVDSNSKYILGYVRSKGGAVNLKRLDVQKGLGADRKGLELAKFEYFNDASQTTKGHVELRVVPVILDKYYGKKTSEYAAGGNPASWASAEYEHQFIYFPTHSQSGFAFLRNNLGSEVSNIKTTYGVFDPSDKPYDGTDGWHKWAYTDIRKYLGSSFQWQRMADGHELIDWMSINLPPSWGPHHKMFPQQLSTGSFKGTIAYNDVPGGMPNWLDAKTNKVITGSSTGMTQGSWVHDMYNPDAASNPTHPDLQHWKPAGVNMPCPVGHKIVDIDIDNFYMNRDINSQDFYDNRDPDRKFRVSWFPTVSAVTNGGNISLDEVEFYVNSGPRNNSLSIRNNHYAYPTGSGVGASNYTLEVVIAETMPYDRDYFGNSGYAHLYYNGTSSTDVYSAHSWTGHINLDRIQGSTIRCVQGH